MTHLYIRRRCPRSHSSLDLVHISLHCRFFTPLSPSSKDPSVLTRVALSETINTLQTLDVYRWILGRFCGSLTLYVSVEPLILRSPRLH